MRPKTLLLAAAMAALLSASIFACSSDGGPGEGGARGGGVDGGEAAAEGGARADAPAFDSAFPPEEDANFPGTPSVQFIGRFDNGDPLGPRVGWPGARIRAWFDGTGVSAKLTQTDGASGGPTYLNVVVDGGASKTVSVSGAQTLSLASDLPPGTHTIELEKRTEAPFGTVRFEGFTFTGGAGLLPPAPRPQRRIEVLGDSFVDGFGVDGDRSDPLKCGGGTAPAQFNDARKSVAAKAAESLGAELHLITQVGKGIARNQDGQAVETFPVIFGRTLPDVASPWSFSAYVPDIVVIALGQADFDPATGLPAEMQTTYNQMITALHASYGNTTPILLTVWSQAKTSTGLRPALTAVIDAVVAGRPNADKPYNFRFAFPEAEPADETACQFHANAAHHAAMAALLAAEIRLRTGWN